MKYMCQLGIILLFSLLGELLHALIPGPVPASIYGFVLLLVCLYTKVIKLEMVEETADFLISLLPLIISPLCVRLMVAGEELKEMFLPTMVISVVTTVLAMALTAWLTQLIINRRKRS